MPGKQFRIYFRLLWTTLLVLVCFAAVANAAPRVSVTLTYFRGESSPEGARLEWQTATELDTAGFRIARASSADGPYADLAEIGILPAQGSATSGSTYEALDATATSGQTYWYKLIEIEYSGSENELQVVSLAIGAAPTATIEGIATTDGDNNTPEPTESTAGNTPTPSPTGTLPLVTNTPRATATGAPVNPTTVVSPEPTPDDATVLRPPGDVADSTSTRQPVAIAQATEGYPGAAATDVAPGDAYPDPDDDQVSTPTLEPTIEDYPPGMPLTDTRTGPASMFENTVGTTAEGGQTNETQSQQSSNLGRILLWVGFVAALLIFIGGAVFSILLSTRKQG